MLVSDEFACFQLRNHRVRHQVVLEQRRGLLNSGNKRSTARAVRLEGCLGHGR